MNSASELIIPNIKEIIRTAKMLLTDSIEYAQELDINEGFIFASTGRLKAMYYPKDEVLNLDFIIESSSSNFDDSDIRQKINSIIRTEKRVLRVEDLKKRNIKFLRGRSK